MNKVKTIQVKINKGLPGYSEGATTTVTVDDLGVPLEKFWRDRFQDAKTDKCVEIVQAESKKKAPVEETK